MYEKLKQRKVGIAEIMVLSIIMFRENIKSYWKMALMIGVPVSAVITYVSNSGITSGGLMTYLAAMASGNAGNISEADFFNFVKYYAIFMLVQAVSMPLVTMAGAYFARAKVEGVECSEKEAVLASLGKGSVIIFAAIIKELFVMSTSILIIPCIIVLVNFYFYAHTAVLEDAGVIKCFKQSASVVKGKFFDVMLAMLFIFFMEQSISYMVQLVFSFVPFNPTTELIQRIIITFFGFIFINGSTLLYINRKYMRDGFLPEINIVE